jgi:hypothetical protein
MKYALTGLDPCIIDGVEVGKRLLELSDYKFEVASPLFWVDFSSDLDPTKYFYNPATAQVELATATVHKYIYRDGPRPDSAAVLAYNFMAAKLGWQEKKELSEVLMDEDINRLPVLRHQTYLTSDLSLISTVYQFMAGKYSIKVVNGEVTEFYVFHPEDTGKQDVVFVSYDVASGQPLEYYRQTPQTESKYDFLTDNLLQVNYFSTYLQLPETVKKEVSAFRYKDYISIYAEKPYGRIIECTYN